MQQTSSTVPSAWAYSSLLRDGSSSVTLRLTSSTHLCPAQLHQLHQKTLTARWVYRNEEMQRAFLCTGPKFLGNPLHHTIKPELRVPNPLLTPALMLRIAGPTGQRRPKSFQPGSRYSVAKTNFCSRRDPGTRLLLLRNTDPEPRLSCPSWRQASYATTSEKWAVVHGASQQQWPHLL